MLDHRARADGGRLRRLRALRLPAVPVAIMAGVAACHGVTGASGSPPPTARNDAVSSQYSAAQLRSALLTSAAGATEATNPEAGNYGSLPGVEDTKAALTGVTITPARCARAATTGLDSAAFNSAPAAVTSFRRGQRGISEVLLAPPASVAPQALGHRVPAGCAHYRAVAGGRTFNYTIKDEPAPVIGLGAREIRVHASGAASTDIWTVIYRTSGYVGAVTLMGSGTTSKEAQEITQQAYVHAEQTLH